MLLPLFPFELAPKTHLRRWRAVEGCRKVLHTIFRDNKSRAAICSRAKAARVRGVNIEEDGFFRVSSLLSVLLLHYIQLRDVLLRSIWPAANRYVRLLIDVVIVVVVESWRVRFLARHY